MYKQVKPEEVIDLIKIGKGIKIVDLNTDKVINAGNLKIDQLMKRIESTECLFYMKGD